jgi:hypothetical protein
MLIDVMENIKKVLFRAATVAFITLLGCGVLMAQEVRYNYDQAVDFTKYKTYKWVDIAGGSVADELTDLNIMQAIESILTTKGLTNVDRDSADLYVGYQAAEDKEKPINMFGGPGWRWTGSQVTTSSVSVGTLVLDIYDPATKTLVWRGTVSKTINPTKNPEKNYEKLQQGIVKMLKNFPPRHK